MSVQYPDDNTSKAANEEDDTSGKLITSNRQKENGKEDRKDDVIIATNTERTHTSSSSKDQDEENVTETTTMVGSSTKKVEESFLKKLRTNQIFRRKVYVWICLCFSFHILGWNLGIGGPTLLDLKMIASCSLEEASLFFTAISAGYAIASFVISITFDRFDKFLHILLGNLGIAVVMVIIPWSVYYGIMLTLHLVKGFMCGISELAASTLLIHMMGQEVKTYMQILHFSYTVGGILSPLAASPFLTQVNVTEAVDVPIYINETVNDVDIAQYKQSFEYNISTTSTLNLSENTDLDSGERPHSSDVYKIYSIIGGISFLPVIIFFLLFLKCDEELTTSDKKNDEKKSNTHLPFRLLIPVLIILNLIAFFMFSIEDTVISFTAAYAVKHFAFTKVMASYATSVFWTSFSIGSFSGIFIARNFATAKLLLFYSFVLVLSSICLFVTSQHYINAGMWAFNGISGFFMSLNFPLLYAWAEEDFLHVSAKIMAALTVSASTGVITSPIIVGVLIELSSIYYSYFIFAESIALCSFIFIGKLLTIKVKLYHRNTETEIEVDVTEKDITELKGVESNKICKREDKQ